ncbi:MAG TPA: hypothetical protein VFL27_15920 [Candidatus Dormibacteraeota bacterium]|nr:hypothetical protein [Candidatus Dormibacteraeota bacterium]
MTLLRRALLVQGVCLLVPVLLLISIAAYLTARPPACAGWCLNLAPFFLLVAAAPFVPPLVVILLLAWRWRRPATWPAVLLGVANLAIFALTWAALSQYPMQSADPLPAVGLAPLLVILPAVATTLLAIDVLSPIPWIPVLGLAGAACVLMGALLAFNVIGPPHQQIPGELALSFPKTVVYEGRDLGCRDYVAGWVQQHTCTAQALVVYRGSGDPYADQLTIDKAVEDKTRYSPTMDKIETLPVDAPFGRSYLSTADYRNGGGCLLIIDRSLQAPPQPPTGHCGTAADYSDIRAHWPGTDAYAIGIVYRYDRPG